LPGGAQVEIDFLDDVDGQSDGARLVHDGAFDGLAYPPGGVGGEAEAAFGIELFHRVDEAEVAFLDEVQQRQAAVDVAAGDLHDQAQVGNDHALARRLVAAPCAPREVHFLFRGQQRTEADLVEIKTGGVE